jgi:glutamate N-acetyltransferase/amino-acid N-acetyltransferase
MMMAVGKSTLPALHPIAGVRLGVVAAGIKKPNELDVVLIELAPKSTVAGVFTRNRFRAAPVRLAESNLRDGDIRYLLINTGNANAGTGAMGDQDVAQNCRLLAAHAGCEPAQILPYSTGVIGERLPADAIDAAIPAALAALTPDGWALAADAIRTTDTRPKGRSETIPLEAGPVTLTGIVKGSGMIRPDMATMLAYIATDAGIERDLLRRLLRDAVARSFNRISVDGDTSTNDACTLIATGESDVALTSKQDIARFADGLLALCTDLAREVVADGEGATRQMAVRVQGAKTEDEAEQVAFCVAESPLVKTAVFAGDPNWGRILAAVGRSGVNDLEVSTVAIAVGGHLIAEGGVVSSGYDEAIATELMAALQIDFCIDLGRGNAEATVWGCDFSYDYVRINAEYRS